MSGNSAQTERYGRDARYPCRRAECRAGNFGLFCYLTVGKSGLDTSYVPPG